MNALSATKTRLQKSNASSKTFFKSVKLKSVSTSLNTLFSITLVHPMQFPIFRTTKKNNFFLEPLEYYRKRINNFAKITKLLTSWLFIVNDSIIDALDIHSSLLNSFRLAKYF